jgi:hypothetical protein
MIQGGDEGGRFPMTVWHFLNQAMATRGTASQTRHIRFGPRFINKNQSLWIQMQLLDTPTRPPLGHVGSILLGRVNHFL